MTSFSKINGVDFFYEIAGEGRPLAFVHAGIADSRMWDEQFHIFSQWYKVVRYDRRGFGKTSMIAGDYSHYNDLYELLKFLKINRALLIGCSQGAKTIIDFSLEHPEMAQALVLVAPAVGGFSFTGEPPRQAQQIELAEEAGDLELVNELELQVWVDGPRRSPEQVDQNLRERVRMMNAIALQTPADLGNEQPLEPPAINRLDEIHAPTLIVAGDLDTAKTIAAAEYLTTHIAGAQRVILPDTAHLPNMEKPNEFNLKVLSFLDDYR